MLAHWPASVRTSGGACGCRGSVAFRDRILPKPEREPEWRRGWAYKYPARALRIIAGYLYNRTNPTFSWPLDNRMPRNYIRRQPRSHNLQSAKSSASLHSKQASIVVLFDIEVYLPRSQYPRRCLHDCDTMCSQIMYSRITIPPSAPMLHLISRLVPITVGGRSQFRLSMLELRGTVVWVVTKEGGCAGLRPFL